MTLALYGKSRRRQLILLVAAVVSVALSTLGGATLRSAGQAEANTGWISPNGWEPSGVSGHTGWDDPTGAFTSGGLAAGHIFYQSGALVLKDFGLAVPSDATVSGVEVSVSIRTESGGTATGCRVYVALSSDGGATYTSRQSITSFQSSFAVASLGGSTDLWGRPSWSSLDLGDANFRVRLLTSGTFCTSLGDVEVDHVQVQVYFEEPETREITFQKMVKNTAGDYVEDTDPTAWGFRYGASDGVYDDATVINNGASAAVPITDGVGVWELVPDGYVLDGLSVVGLDVCPATPGIDRNTTGPAEAGYGAGAGSGDLLFCFYNEEVATEPATREITVQKMVWNGTEYEEWDGAADFWGFRHAPNDVGYDNATPINNGGTFAADSSFIWEAVPENWSHKGISVTTGDVCLDGPFAELDVPGPTEVSASVSSSGETAQDILYCFYNEEVATEPETREITVQKMVPNPDVAGGWMEDDQATFWGFEVGPSAVYGHAGNQAVDNGDTNTFVAGTTLYAFEQIPAGWQKVGNSAVIAVDATCPAQPDSALPSPQTAGSFGIELTDTSDVTVCFYNERNLDPVTVEKSGTGSYDVDWSVTKTVTPDVLNLPDDGSDTTDYTVTVEKTISNIQAAGDIEITNPNPVAIEVTVSDPGANLGGLCASNPVTVPAADSITCGWTEAIGGSSIPTGYTNTVTVSGPWDGSDVEDTTAPIVFTIDGGTDEVTVDDNFAGEVEGDKPDGDVITEDTTYEYTATHSCEGIVNWSELDGSGSKTVENAATITDTVGNNNSDDADVDITCQRPHLTVVKSDDNDVEPLEWDVAIPGHGSGTAIYRAFVPSGSVQSVSESGPSGYTLESLTCLIDGTATELDVAVDGSFTMPTGAQAVTCTFVNIADQPLAIEKIAEGTYDDVWNWTINKDGNITEFTGAAGATFDVDYTTTSTPEKVGKDNGEVSGQVTITNSNNFGIDVSLADTLGDFETLACEANPGGTIANPDSGFDVPANGSVVCDYTVDGADTDAGTNTVTVTSVEYPDLDGSDDATIDWSPNGNAADPAYLHDNDNYDEDPNNPFTANYTEETTEQVENYERAFVCPAWPSDVYYDGDEFTGEYTFDIVNTAVLYENDNLEGDEWDRDDHTVAVTCTVDPASVEVQKSVNWNGVPEENRPDAEFEICIAGPFEDLTVVSEFLTNMPTSPYAPDNAPSGDWIECETVAPGGVAGFDGLAPGAYGIAEKDPGPAFIQATNPVPANLAPGAAYVVPGESGINNTYQLGDLTVTKDIELAGGDLPDGSAFTICIQGASYPNGDEASACRTFTTDEQAETWENLVPGAYTVSESSTAPADVDWATTITNSGNVNVPAGGEGSATVTNTLVTGDLAVTKVINWSGFVPAADTLDDSAAFQPFEICIQGPSYPNGDESGACQYVTNVNGQTLQWENLAAGTYTVTETDPGAIWNVVVDPADAGTAGAETCAPDDTACETPQVTITNTLAPANVTICKDFAGSEDEGVLPGITIDGQSIDTRWSEVDCFPIEVAPFTPLTVTEVLPDGYFPAQEPIVSGQCTILQPEEQFAELIIAQTLSFLGIEFKADWLASDLSGIPAGESCTVTFTNEPVGELVIVKDDRTTGDEPVTWLFDVEIGEATDAAVIIGSGSDRNIVGTGAYTVSERAVEGLSRVDVCQPNSPSGSYEVSVVVTQGGVVGGEVAGATAEVTVARDETTTVAFINRDCGEVLGGANLIARKFEATGPNVYGGTDGLGGWTMTLECTSGACGSVAFPGELATDGSGVAAFLLVPSGEYELCEVPQGGYDVVGSLLDGGSPVAGVCRDVTVTEEAAGGDGNIVVDFFNYEIPEEETPTPENTATATPEIPDVPNTPTNTPDVPDNTPEPTETPVDPAEEPTVTPTPVDEVEGEITPGTPTEDAGLGATPIPPASGTGGGATGSGAGIFVAIIGMLAVLGGATTVVAARRR